MFKHLALNHYPVGIAAIVFSILVALLVQHAVKKYVGVERIRKGHEVCGYYLAIAGTFYAVLLGLVVVDAMSNFKDAENSLESEAAALMNIHTMAERFPEQSPRIRELTRSYADRVLDEELPLMAKGQVSMNTRQTAVRLIEVLKDIEPRTENQKALYGSLLNSTSALWDARRDRTRISNYGIPTPEWVVLIVGAVITVLFTFFFVIESARLHFFMTGLIVLLINMSLYLVLLFGAPFAGDLRVSDRAFQVARDYFKEQP